MRDDQWFPTIPIHFKWWINLCCFAYDQSSRFWRLIVLLFTSLQSGLSRPLDNNPKQIEFHYSPWMHSRRHHCIILQYQWLRQWNLNQLPNGRKKKPLGLLGRFMSGVQLFNNFPSFWSVRENLLFDLWQTKPVSCDIAIAMTFYFYLWFQKNLYHRIYFRHPFSPHIQ